jgi:hypothetical protein
MGSSRPHLVARTAPRVRVCLLTAAALLLLAGSGCEALFRSLVPVVPLDAEPGFADAATDGEAGTISATLSLDSLTPEHGSFAGGTDVVLSGTGFGSKTTVKFGGKAVQATQIKVLSPIAVEVTTPAGKPGLVDVQVTSGGASVTLSSAYRYDPVLLDPATGPAAGGTLVTLEGFGTHFSRRTRLTLGGAAMTDVEVVSATVLRAKTPAGTTGPADLAITATGLSTADLTVPGAFEYYQTANQKNGGMSGGTIKGTVTVAVLDWDTKGAIKGATVVLQKGRTLSKSGKTDSKGAWVYSDASLTGPVSVTAGKSGYETTSVLDFDARDLTIFLQPLPNPQPGAFPPGSKVGVVKGHILFGDATGIGSPNWTLVPSPKTGQVRRAYVFTTNGSISWSAPYPTSGGTIDWTKTGATAWPYTLYTRTGIFAVYAVAGIYTKSTGVFDPYALGVLRGVVVGPGETLTDEDIWVNLPLTEKITVELTGAPSETNAYSLRLGIDLGAEGLIMMSGMEASGEGTLSSQVFPRLPDLTAAVISDATYTVDLTLDTTAASNLPSVRATERQTLPTSGKILIDDLVGVPIQVKPEAGGTIEANTLAWSSTGATPSFSMLVLTQSDETPVWRVISSGDIGQAKLPDPTTFGLPSWPSGPLVWQMRLVHIPSFSFDNFTYSHLNSKYWDRWSYDEFEIEGP